MTGPSLSWIDGRWGEANAPELPLNDRGLLMADGLFETVLVPKMGPWNLKNRALPAAGAVFFTFRGFAFRVAFGPQLEAILGSKTEPNGDKMGFEMASEI